jgi:PST family polysaccharide transporter
MRTQLYWNTLLKIPSQVVAFAISIYVARILAPSDFGVMGIAMMLIGYANMFTDFGFGEAIIQKRIDDRGVLNSIFTLNFGISLVLAAAFFMAAGFIGEFFHSRECAGVIRLLSSYFLVTSFPVVPAAMLRRDMNFRTLSVIGLASSVTMSVSTLLLALKGFGYWALALGQLIPAVIFSALYCVVAGWAPTFSYRHAAIKSIYHFSFWNFVKTQLGFLAQHVDRFIVGRWLGVTNLGYYDKSLTIALVPQQTISANINSVMYSWFSANQQRSGEVRSQFGRSLSLVSFVNFPLYFGLLAICPYLVHAVLGRQWLPMIAPFEVILVACIVSTFNGSLASLNIGVGNYRPHIQYYMASVAVFVVCCLALLRYGILGTAVAYLVFMLVSNYLALRLAMKHLALSWGWVAQAIRSGLLGSGLMFGVLVLLARYACREYTSLNLMILVVVGAVTYALFVLSDRSERAVEFRGKAAGDLVRLWNALPNWPGR